MIRNRVFQICAIGIAAGFASSGCDNLLDMCECDCEEGSIWDDDDGYTDNTGNSQADDIIGDADVEKAIRDSGFPIHSGTNPPNLEGSYYPVTGTIEKSYGARPVGSPIDSPGTCLYDQTPSGSLSYQEYGVDQASGSYITGNGNNYTVYLESAGGTYLFSGTKNGNNLDDVVGLVVYKAATGTPGSWEYSVTDWTWESSDCRDNGATGLTHRNAPLVLIP